MQCVVTAYPIPRLPQQSRNMSGKCLHSLALVVLVMPLVQYVLLDIKCLPVGMVEHYSLKQ